MERLTTNRSWEEARKDLENELGYSHIWKRLNVIEDILGYDYDLDRLREMIEESKQIDKMLKVGDDVWYVDFDKGDIEKGKVETVSYKDGKLDCFGVDFGNDFDVFDGSGWGECFFGSELNARKALLMGDKSWSE